MYHFVAVVLRLYDEHVATLVVLEEGSIYVPDVESLNDLVCLAVLFLILWALSARSPDLLYAFTAEH